MHIKTLGFAAFFLLWVGLIIWKRRRFPRLTKWVVEGVHQTLGKTTMFWFVAYELGLILTSCVPYLRIGTHAFAEYVAFASPAAAGIVVGGSIFFDPNPKYDDAGKAYLVSLVLILMGWIGFLCADEHRLMVLVWSLLLTIFSATSGLTAIAVKLDCTTRPLSALFFPMVLGVGVVSVVFGLVAFFLDKQLIAIF